MSLFRSADAILPIEPSGPGSPILRFWLARMFVSRSTSARIHSFITSSRVAASLRSLGQVAPHLDQRGDRARALRRDRAADRDPLVHQRGQRDPPAVAGLAEQLGVGDAGVGEEDLVELGLAGHLAQRPDLDAGRLHVDDERGEAGVLHRFGVGAHDEQAPARQVGERGPHLLAVDDPLVAVAHALATTARRSRSRRPARRTAGTRSPRR